MRTFAEQLADLAKAGYRIAEAHAKVAHDAILFAMHKSGFKVKLAGAAAEGSDRARVGVLGESDTLN